MRGASDQEFKGIMTLMWLGAGTLIALILAAPAALWYLARHLVVHWR